MNLEKGKENNLIYIYIQGYSGELCENKINECDKSVNPCRNGGRCQTLEFGYKCDCRPGFTGSFNNFF